MKDNLDSILLAAAKNAGEPDICEYNGDGEVKELRYELAEKILSGVGEKKKTMHLRLGRRIAIIAAAALLVCGMTIGSIAGKKKYTAPAVISEVAGSYVLTYNTDGIKLGGEPEVSLPSAFENGYELCGETEGGGIYRKDDTEILYKVRKLDGNMSFALGDSDTTEVFEITVHGKYSGCVAVNMQDGVKMSRVSWNDGNFVYELFGNAEADVLCEIAQSIHR